MSTLIDKLAAQMKAIIGAFIIALVGVAQWVVTSPDTAPAIQSVFPQFAQFVPLILGIAGTIVGYLAIYFKKNTPTSESTAAVAVEEPDLDTRMLTIPNSGEFTGAGAQ